MIGVQQRLVELGRIRTGERGEKGEPRRLTKFRLTSASRPLLEAAAKLYGGTVRAWQGAPDDGYWELYTTADTMNIVIPPMGRVYTLAYELWSGGGVDRRCDGEIEQISGGDCLCDPAKRECSATTRVQVMLPDLPGLGVWRVESHGYNAAAKLPPSIELLRALGGSSFTPAILRLVAHSKKVRLENGRSQTHRWMEPEIDTPETIGALLSMGSVRPAGAIAEPAGTQLAAGQPLSIGPGPSRPPRGTKVERPQLGPPPALPETSDFRKPEQPPVAATPPPPPSNGHAPETVAGWAVTEDDEEVAPAAASPPPVKRPKKGEKVQAPPPLTMIELDQLLQGEGVNLEHAQRIFRRRFPNTRELTSLDDEQRGRYWHEVSTTPPDVVPDPPPAPEGLTADQLTAALAEAGISREFAVERSKELFAREPGVPLTEAQRAALLADLTAPAEAVL
jgi:hypothetical protein